MYLPRCALHFTELLRHETEQRLARTGADRLRKSEVLRVAFEFSFRPRTPDAAMVQVADCEIDVNQPSCRSLKRLDLAAADIGCRQLRSWQLAGFCLIAENLPTPVADHHRLAFANGGHIICSG